MNNITQAAHPVGGAGGGGRGGGGPGRGRGGQHNNVTHAAPPSNFPPPIAPQFPVYGQPPPGANNASTGGRESGQPGVPLLPPQVGQSPEPLAGASGPLVAPSASPSTAPSASPSAAAPSVAPSATPSGVQLAAGLTGFVLPDGTEIPQPVLIDRTTKKVDELLIMVRRIQKILESCHHNKKRSRDETEDEEEEGGRVSKTQTKKAATGTGKGKAVGKPTRKGAAKSAAGGGNRKVSASKGATASGKGKGKGAQTGAQSTSQPRSDTSGRIGCDFDPCTHSGADAPTLRCSVKECSSLAHAECLPKTKRGHAPRSWKCNEHD